MGAQCQSPNPFYPLIFVRLVVLAFLCLHIMLPWSSHNVARIHTFPCLATAESQSLAMGFTPPKTHPPGMAPNSACLNTEVRFKWITVASQWLTAGISMPLEEKGGGEVDLPAVESWQSSG